MQGTTMQHRRGERIGWTVGWLGGFVWVFILSVVFLVQAKWLEGVSGLVLVGIAVAGIAAAAPWRHPSTPYWRLMLPLYVILFLAVAWAVRSFGGTEDTGLQWWNLSWGLILLIPLGSAGRRKWSDSNTPQDGPTDSDTSVH